MKIISYFEKGFLFEANVFASKVLYYELVMKTLLLFNNLIFKYPREWGFGFDR